MKEYHSKEVEIHNKQNDCWIIIEEKIYDITNFIEKHPGGKRALMIYAGKDATEEFNALHHPSVIDKHLTKENIVGKLTCLCKL